MDELTTTNEKKVSSFEDEKSKTVYEQTSETIEEIRGINRIKNEQEGDISSVENDKNEKNQDYDFNIRPENVEGEQDKKGKMSSTYVLLVIFIILLGVSYVIKNKTSFVRNGLGEENKIIRGIEAKDIDKIEILKDEKTTVLENREGIWKVSSQNNFIADQQAVKSLVDEAFELNRYILASENTEKFADFEVDEKRGANIKLYKGGEEHTNFYVGKTGPDFDSTYLRVAGDNNVYLSKGYVRYYFDKDEWRDLSIYDFETEKVKKLALKYKDVSQNVMMEKIEGKWKIPGLGAKEADKNKVDSVLNTLAKLKARDVEYNKSAKEAGFGLALLVVRLELEDGGKRNLIIGGKLENEEDKYYAKREEDEIIYIINKAIVDGLMKKAGDF